MKSPSNPACRVTAWNLESNSWHHSVLAHGTSGLNISALSTLPVLPVLPALPTPGEPDLKLGLQMLQCMASHDISEIGTLLLCSTYFNFNIFNVILLAKHATSQNHVFRLARLRQTTVRNTHSKPRFLARGGRSAVSAIRRPSSFEDGSQNVPNPKTHRCVEKHMPWCHSCRVKRNWAMASASLPLSLPIFALYRVWIVWRLNGRHGNYMTIARWFLGNQLS